MIRIQLDEVTRAELQSLRHSAPSPKVRDRLEMVLLSVAGWSPPRIASFLACDPQTVRKVLHGFQLRGPDSLTPRKPGPAPDPARRDHLTGRLRDLLTEERTWTSAQLAEALHPHGIDIGSRQVRRYLRLLKAGYRRTASTLEHKQDPARCSSRSNTTRSPNGAIHPRESYERPWSWGSTPTAASSTRKVINNYGRLLRQGEKVQRFMEAVAHGAYGGRQAVGGSDQPMDHAVPQRRHHLRRRSLPHPAGIFLQRLVTLVMLAIERSPLFRTLP